MTTAMLFGTFDIIHPGHVNLFSQAKKHADELIIVIARDATVKRIKGFSPHFNEIERKRNLEHFDTSLKVELGDLDDPYAKIKELKPDVICLGYDQAAFVDELGHVLKENDIKAKVVRLKPYKEKMYKSYMIRQEIAKKGPDLSIELEMHMNNLRKEREDHEVEETGSRRPKSKGINAVSQKGSGHHGKV